MNIILLSGGSGKRLWPLSNDIRSKQFIKMFRNENGEYESMIQRVYQQIIATDPEADVTIATSKKQASAIRNQLGDKISICVEPCRKDTFPAIALAASYLHYEKGIKPDETVIVCPVDPYVGDGYFKALKDLEDVAKTSGGELNLMGIEPDHPSERYGYIIPETEEKVSKVKEFKEKPDSVMAVEYIKQGALWNSGVFAFKIGYLLKKVHELIDYRDYMDLYERYEEQTKISFDYAVVEKEPNIRVMRYYGEWRDLGSWNAFTEAMYESVIGKATLDKCCKNTNVINETDIPILCMGLENVIVAASVDGILVSDREKSGYIKPYVDNMDEQVRYAEKSWGSFMILDVQKNSLTIKIVLNEGSRLNYHEHEYRDEVWTIMSGNGKVILNEEEKMVTVGDVIKIPIGCKHTVIAETELEILEVQLGDEISVEDKRKY